MRSRLIFAFLCVSAARTAFALTCGGFSIVTADHVVVKYSAPLATGTTRSTPLVSINGTDITVTRTLSGGSATDVSCVDDTIDLGYLGAGRFNVLWNDNVNFTTARSTFTFSVGAPATGFTGDLIDVLPPALPDRPVRLEVNSCSRNPAIAYVSGNDVYLSQYAGERTSCKLSILDLGMLPSGTYNVSSPPGTLLLRFVVQQPAPTSACSGNLTITPMAGGTARLHFEDPYRGYTPAFGPPTVAAVADYPLAWPPMVTVVQTVADTANAYASGAPPSSAICHAEELDLGSVSDGYHEVWWWYDVNVNGFESYTNAVPFSFYWQNGTAQCTSDPGRLLTPSAVEGARVDLAVNFLHLGWQAGTTVNVDGHTITVDIRTFFEGPSDSVASCQTFRATVGQLPAGEYAVVWRIDGARQVFTTPLTVVKPTRERAARH